MLLAQREVCQELRVSAKTLQRWRKEGRIEYLSFGHRSIRYTSEEIEKFKMFSTNSHEQLPERTGREKGHEVRQ